MPRDRRSADFCRSGTLNHDDFGTTLYLRSPCQIHLEHRAPTDHSGYWGVTVAAYQAPLLPPGSREAVDLIRRRVHWCESHGVAILCCPEAILGGLADNAADPREFAIDAHGDQLVRSLAPLASDT